MLLNTNLDNAIIQSRAQKAITSIEQKIQNGEIGTEEVLLTNIQSAWKEIFSETLSSTIEVPDFRSGELPMKSSLEDPLFAAEQDINNIWDQLEHVRSDLVELFNREKSETASITTLLGAVQNKASRFQLYSSDSESSFLWSSDSFTSTDKIDQRYSTAFIDTEAGVVMLKATGLDSLLKYVTKFTIDKENSDGIPGNNLVVASEDGTGTPDSSSPEPQVTLQGATDLHSQVAYIFDNQPNTWMEWERNYIPRFQKAKSVGTAWKKDASGQQVDVVESTKDTSNQPAGWKKFIQWPGSQEYDRNSDGKGYYIADFENQKPAKLIFTIEFDQPRKISTIQVTPQILGGIYPIVRKLSVSRSGQEGYSRVLAKDVYLTSKLNESLKTNRAGVPEGNYTGIGLWTVEDKLVSSISFSLEAGGYYTPDLGFGHHYYFRIINKRTETHVLFVSFVSNSTKVERLPNPDQGISTGVTGFNLSAVGQLAGAILGGTLGSTIGGVVGSLIGSSTSTSIVRQGDAYDIFDGSRSAIGLKDIDISVREYDTESVIVSQPHIFFKPIQAVSIIATESIPADWDNSTDWITYEVSSDGTNWIKIIPQNRVNSSNDTAYITGNSVLVRVTLKRPSDRVNESPTLLSYALKCLPA